MLLVEIARGQQHFIQVRSIAQNHTEDQWVAVAPIRDTVTVRDTLYMPKEWFDSVRRSKIKVPETVKYDSSIFTRLTVEWKGRITYARSKAPAKRKAPPKRKATKKVRAAKKKGPKVIHYKVRPSACPLDTVRGILIYNSNGWGGNFDGAGNAVDSGYWIGCNPHFIEVNEHEWMIPARYIQGNGLYTVVKINGRFKTLDFTSIPTSRVYELRLKWQ